MFMKYKGRDIVSKTVVLCQHNLNSTDSCCLSGLLIAKSGKTLIFGMMSNNFVSSSTELRREMEKILKMVYEKY